MSLSLFFLSTASAIAGSQVVPNAEDHFVYCRRADKEHDRDWREVCDRAASVLRDEAEVLLKKKVVARNVAANICADVSQKIVSRGQPNDARKFDDVLKLLVEQDQATPSEYLPNGAYDLLGKKQDTATPNLCQDKSSSSKNILKSLRKDQTAAAKKLLEEFTKAEVAFSKAGMALDAERSRFTAQAKSFAEWGASKGLAVKQVASVSPSNSPITLADCDLNNLTADIQILRRPKACRSLGEAEALPLTRWASEGSAKPPNPWNIEQTLKTGTAGSNVEVVFGGNIASSGLDFERGNYFGENQPVRRPRTLSYTLGAEAAATDGVGTLLGGNVESGDNFLSRSRLDGNFVFKGSAGMNFFARQSQKEFRLKQEEFLGKARTACEKSLTAAKTKVATTCKDEMLLAWLYEVKDKKYLRDDLVKEYANLIYRSGEKLPRYGFGGTFSGNLRSQDFFLFSDEDRNLDLSFVDVDQFFTPDANDPYELAGSIEQKLAYTLGGYGFVHFPMKSQSWLDGITLIGRGTYKSDIESGLDKKQKEICRSDISTVPSSSPGLFDNADRCRNVLPFRPVFEDIFVGEVEARIGLNQFWIFPDSAIAPKFEYEARGNGVENDGSNDAMRFELPLYFTLDKDTLVGGIGVSHEVDFDRAKDQKAATAIFIFVGRKFTLDGSK